MRSMQPVSVRPKNDFVPSSRISAHDVQLSSVPRRTVMFPGPSAKQMGGAKAFVLSAIERIEAVILEETEALRKSSNYDLASSNNRKSHSIVDFNNAIRNLQKSDIDAELIDRLETMRQHLRENHYVIKLHLEAAKEISAVLSDALQDAESDGTYSRYSSGMRMSA